MAKSLVFHIGDPKTGTSSIQRALFDRSFSSPVVALDYPAQLNAFPLANALWDPAQAVRRDERFEAAAAWLAASPADIGVISAEMFFKVDPVVMQEAIAHYMPDHAKTARIVAYVRPHAPRFLAQFVQISKTGTYWGDMQTLLNRVSKKGLLTYTPRFQAWQKVFGDRFTLRPMVRDALHDRDVVSDFLKQVLGGAPFSLKESPSANESLPLEVLSGLRAVHAVLNKLGVSTENRQGVGQFYVNPLNAMCEGRGTKIKLSEAIYDQIAAMCRDDAVALDQAFFGGPVMQNELERAGQDTVPEMMSAEVSSHFPPEVIRQIRNRARNLAGLLTENQTIWRQSFFMKIGQVPHDPVLEARVAARSRHIKKVEAALAAIATLITRNFLSEVPAVSPGTDDQQKAR